MSNKHKKIDQNLSLTINILAKNKIRYWICHGTLLGIIRDKKLISWDHDIDIGVIENTINRKLLQFILEKGGFKRIKKTFLHNDGMMKFIKKGGREVDINFYRINKKSKTVFVKWHIPRNFFMKIIDALSFAKSYKGKSHKLINIFAFSEKFFLFIKKIFVINGFFYSRAGYSHNQKYALELIKYNFHGLKLLVPKDYNNYLKDLYGNKWRIPMKKYNWIRHSPSTIKFNK